MQVDIAVVGAGPAGLCFARSLADSGLSIALIERQPLSAIEQPAFDGREIALTHASRRILRSLGIWDRIDADEISPLGDAKVMSGPSPFAMKIEAGQGEDPLGWLLPNHLIRKAAFDVVCDQSGLQLLDGVGVAGIHTGSDEAVLTLGDGRKVHARLVVAADSRFSETRRMMGIGARMRDFGKTMMVCRMAHEKSHHQVAWEWFGYGQTLALLPLNGGKSSAVLTLPQHEMAKVMAMEPADFALEMRRRFDGRLGAMELIGTRHAYPLVGVYAQRFVAQRYALIGDAAVGMHPVTAHGFNLGLQSQERLARVLLKAKRSGRDIAAGSVLSEYERGHRRATLPLYLATQLVVSVFTDDRAPAKAVRSSILRFADRMVPFKRLVAAHLTQEKSVISPR